MQIKPLLRAARWRTAFSAVALPIWNLLYALGNLAVGLSTRSYWFVTVGTYFFLLALLRGICTLAVGRESGRGTSRLIGALLACLALALLGSVILSDRRDSVAPMNKIVMIAIAAFTTVKTALAVVNTVSAHRVGDPALLALRNVSCADAAASILSLQRSMLATFGEMPTANIRLMNLLTGIGVCLLILLLALDTYFSRRRVERRAEK